MNKTLVLNNRQVRQKIVRIAHEICEHNFEETSLVLVGIAKNGFKIAQAIAKELKKISTQEVVEVKIVLDKKNPLENITLSSNKVSLEGKTIILIDDVLNSGRTLIYAAKELLESGIKKMNTAVLVDRMHRKFPIRADFAGLTLSTTLQEHITVEFSENSVDVYLV